MAGQERPDYTAEERKQAQKENGFVRQVREKTDLSDAKNALKLYNRLIDGNVFHALVGYSFLEELRDIVIESGIATEDSLVGIPGEKAEEAEKADIPVIPVRSDRHKRMYEGQVLLNKKLKVAVAALVIMLIGFIIINFKLEYSIFTYFTNYKANMEEELIDKYKDWEIQLQQKQQQLEQKEGAGQDG